MTWFLALLVAYAVWSVVHLAVLITRDGLGTRRPPASRAPWSDATQDLPSRPF